MSNVSQNSSRLSSGPVLVTGATGFLGGSLARRLLDTGVPVRALVRSPATAGDLISAGAEVVAGDITDPGAVAAAVEGVEVVYHLAGRLLLPGVPATEYRRTHVEGTQLMLDACARSPALRRFIHCSTTGVLGVTGDRPADEDAPIRPTNCYEATKAAAEHAVRRACQDGFPAVIARPGLVYGPGDLHLLSFFRVVLAGRFRPIGRRAVWLHPIYIDDMTEGLVRCAEHPAALRECFHFAGSRPATLTELAQAIAEAGGTRLPAGHIPMAAARAVAVFGDQLPAALKSTAPLTGSRLAFLTHSRVYDVTRAQRLLDYTTATDLHEGIAQTLAWYRAQGHLPSAARARVVA